MADFRWDKKTDDAAKLIAAGDLAMREIADKVGVTRVTLYNWKSHAQFAARVEGLIEEFRREVARCGLAVRERRVKALNDRWNRLRRVIEARADAPEMADVPGGTTGLLVRTLKGLGSGESFRVVEEYAVDTGLLRELREHEKQAAIETGQWTEKREVSGSLSFDVQAEAIVAAVRVTAGDDPDARARGAAALLALEQSLNVPRRAVSDEPAR